VIFLYIRLLGHTADHLLRDYVKYNNNNNNNNNRKIEELEPYCKLELATLLIENYTHKLHSTAPRLNDRTVVI
jgi:hypothetical protein